MPGQLSRELGAAEPGAGKAQAGAGQKAAEAGSDLQTQAGWPQRGCHGAVKRFPERHGVATARAAAAKAVT